MELGLTEVYTGDGKGKTTAALGLALRAIGHGYKVLVVQFLKGKKDYGEILASKKIKNLEIYQFGREEEVNLMKPEKIDIELARKGFDFAMEKIFSGEYDVVILDEINLAITFSLIPLHEVLNLIAKKPKSVELVLTGRFCPKKIIDVADLVSEVKEIKHPYRKGILSRKGIGW